MPDTTETSQFEADQFLKLLTDALQAGPGTPQWHDAVTRLRASNAPEADEYRMLVEARENLESGRDYRSVHAGPGFTRKVMEGIEKEEATPAAAPPTANILAIVALLVILTVIIVVAALMYKGSAPTGTLQDLQNTTFLQSMVSSEFSQTIGPEWKKFGLEPIISVKEKALRGGVQKEDREEYRGGGIVTINSIAADQPFAIEATIRMARAIEVAVVQVFVTDEPSFDKNKSATNASHELVCYLDKGQLNVARPDGKIAGQPVSAGEVNHVQIKMNKQFVIVEKDGQKLYAGAHGLSAAKPRFVGVRFLTKVPERMPEKNAERMAEELNVLSVRILKP